jgi:hypothetical protein
VYMQLFVIADRAVVQAAGGTGRICALDTGLGLMLSVSVVSSAIVLCLCILVWQVT